MQPAAVLVGSKSDVTARERLLIGNQFLSRGQVYEAIIAYNSALTFAAPGSEIVGTAYGFRAGAYQYAAMYKRCLESIALARQCGCPERFEKNLKELEEKCDRSKHEDAEVKYCPWSFFNLSHPVNERRPFMIDALELRTNDHYGRYIITREELRTGDILAIDEPIFANFDLSTIHNRCKVCHKSNFLSLLPCDGCIKVMYCSERCRDNDEAHSYECREEDGDFLVKNYSAVNVARTAMQIAGGAAELIEMFRNIRNESVFDMDLSDPNDPDYKRKLLRAAHGLTYFNNEAVTVINEEGLRRIIQEEAAGLSAEDLKKLLKIVQRLHRIFEMNSFPIQEDARPIVLSSEDAGHSVGANLYVRSFATCCYPFVSLINHSCHPNARVVAVENKLVLFASRPIKAGQQIFITYGPESHTQSLGDRQSFLKINYNFDCRCEACFRNFPVLNTIPRRDRAYVSPTFDMTGMTTAQAFKDYNLHNEYITDHYRVQPNFEVTISEHYTWFLLHFIVSEARRLNVNISHRRRSWAKLIGGGAVGLLAVLAVLKWDFLRLGRK